MDKRKQTGFTIVELLVALVISMLALGMASHLMVSMSKGMSKSEEYLEHRTSTRLLVSRLYQEARSAREIYECTDDAFEFLFRGKDGADYRVRYEYDQDGDTFARIDLTNGRTEKVLASDLTNAGFKYYDRTGGQVESVYATNINTNAVQFVFTDSIELESNIKISQLESPIIMLRNKRLVR